jgi:outer membrane protein assembly factor BamB
LRLEWTVPIGATSPAVAGGVLFAATTGNKDLLAVDPRTGQLLWTSLAPHAGGSIGYIHWESPIVINGHLYCPDEDGDLVAYGL